MNPTETPAERRQRFHDLRRLTAAQRDLNALLGTASLHPTTRAHLERASWHVREAWHAVNDPASARTVDGLVADLQHRQRTPPPAPTTQPSLSHGISP